ncbi:MAG: hypothetical protein IK079_04415, partial [Desulfovibrio sp.]|nr:hypothetical protein [Desulfovibrio sp.]
MYDVLFRVGDVVVQRIVFFLVCVFLFCDIVFARSMYQTEPCFTPENPEEHATWKGRANLDPKEAHFLCSHLCRYLGMHENTVPFLLEIAAAESDFGYY